ncbi:S8 family serine peptidase [Nonomuraea guangzhouensis]|uniref:S8 family serine peptidase n=1 Tax=Nonomuraea guangzhouensis TaxID=1291555 RepID=A0ABW4FZ08_9ACTN|nr:S8 family serine peptidase [Nonomuraea guangzhouensis]
MNLTHGTLAMIVAGSLISGGATSAAQAAEPVRPVTGVSGSVTLLTGDRVTVAANGYRIEPGPGRKVRFDVQRRQGHLNIIPEDAKRLLAQGLLDERLFDVTQLLTWRYGDAEKAEIPLIVQSAEGKAAKALSGTQDATELAGLGLASVSVVKAKTGQTWQGLVGSARSLAAGKSKIWLDGKRPFVLDQSVKQIGAPQAWQQGLTGAGVTVAVLDSGYDATHPDLKDVVTQSRNFSDDPDTTDHVGHGTHVSSIVAGAGEKYRGVAPGAKIAFGKVGGEFASESALLAGMEWAATEVKAKIVNMSIGGYDSPGIDPLEQAVNTLSERTGVLFVIAAGNDESPGSINSPGSADAALTVGAVDKSDRMASFSSRGPRSGDHAIKPDVTAPGVDITAAAAQGTADGLYVTHSGTSMAAPHVAGAAAILAQRHPDWSGAQLKAALIGSAAPQAGATHFDQGAGRVDVVRAIGQQVFATPANIGAVFRWDGSSERQATKEITYTNAGDSPVTLDLTVDSTVLRTSAQRVDVPAKGTASVTVTIDVTGKTPGDYPGTITARSGDLLVRTVATAYAEPESYGVTVSALGADGRPTDAVGQFYNSKGERHQMVLAGDASDTYRLPAGDWNLYVDIYEDDRVTTTHLPVKVAEHDTEVVLDTRKAKPIRFTVDDPTAVTSGWVEMWVINGSWGLGWSGGAPDPSARYFVLASKQPGLKYVTRMHFHKKDASPTPYRYDLVDERRDGIPEDPTYTARVKDLDKVTTTFRGAGTAAKGDYFAAVVPDDSMPDGFLTPTKDVPLPGTLTEYRTRGYKWSSALQVGESMVMGAAKPIGSGDDRQTWGVAVSGPSFATLGAWREKDTVTFDGARLLSEGVPGRVGMDGAATGTISLAKGDQVISKVDYTKCGLWDSDACRLTADLPAEPATYTLSATAGRQVPYSTLSTKVESTWTFRSASTSTREALALTAVRYAPTGLDEYNRAKPGSSTRLPIWIERNPGAPSAAVKSIRLQMSVDDGATWQNIPVRAEGSGWTARVTNPRTAGFVSLRATSSDTAGSTVSQTIHRAYAVG